MQKRKIASFLPMSKEHASLMCHQGAKTAGTHKILTGDGGTSLQIKRGTVAKVRKKKAIQRVIRAWLDSKEVGAAAKKKSASRDAGARVPARRRGSARKPLAPSA